MKIYIVHENCGLLAKKTFDKITNKEIEEAYDAGSMFIEYFESIEQLSSLWNINEVFDPYCSYMRVIND